MTTGGTQTGTTQGAATARPPLLSLREVGKVFGRDTAALSQLSLDLHEGEFLTLLGPSGCGKSTALRLIAGLIRPTTGTIRWSVPRANGDLSFVFQEPTLMPWATVAGNVGLPFRLSGEDGAAARVAEALDMVGLTEFARAYPRRPRLILMDEPFAALDEITRFRLNDDLLALRAAIGCTIVFVTHSVFESVFLSDRIAVLSARPGRVTEEIAIGQSQPRAEAFRTSPDYAALCGRASDALRRAMGPETAHG